MTALPARIESKFIPEPNSGCWLWLGGTNQKNYGHIWSSELKRHQRAHRMVYQILVGAIPAGKQLLHSCDNPYCVNPDHMFVGSNAENMADRNAKSRQAKGETCALSKLTEDQVKEIRTSLDMTAAIAEKFNTSRRNVYDIRKRRTWKHI